MHANKSGAWRPLGKCRTSQTIGYISSQFNLNVPMALLKEALEQLEIPSKVDFYSVTIEMGREVGMSNCVPVTDEDTVFWACCENTPNRYMRFVQGRNPVPVTSIAVRLKCVGPSSYKVTSAYFGKSAPLFPYECNAEAEVSTKFWQQNALIPTGDNPILLASIREEMPG